MGHYHPVSYEIEGRIRQGEKLEQARRQRQAQAVRAGRERSRPAGALFSRVGSAVAAIVAAVSAAFNSPSSGAKHAGCAPAGDGRR